MRIKRQSQVGLSILGLVIGTFLLSVALAGVLNLASMIKTGPGADAQAQYFSQLTALSEIVDSRIALGGGAVNHGDSEHGIQVCNLNTGSNGCGSYSGNSSSICIALPTRVGQGTSSTMEISGIRLKGGQIQERILPNVNLSSFSLNAFCAASGDWQGLNSTSDFIVESLRFCRFAGDVIANLGRNFESSCPSILDSDQASNTFWITLIKIRPTAAGFESISNISLSPLLNSTKVTSL